MATLGELLELIHDAAERAHPAQLTVTEWRHGPRSAKAWDAYMKARHPGAFVRGSDPVPEGPKESRWTVQLFVEALDRFREESAGRQAGVRYLVRDGERWLTWDADWGLVSSDSEPEGGPPAAAFGFLLDPVELVAALRLGPPSEDSMAGRRVLTVPATPREDQRGSTFLRIGPGADVVDLSFDAETGALLRSEARLDGEPFHRIEVSEIAYRPAPPETFLVAPPEDYDGAAGRWMRPVELPLHEVAAIAPFTVLVPARVPPGWRLGSAQLLEPRERPVVEAMAFLDYASPEGAYSIAIRERASDEGDREPDVDDRSATVAPRFTVTLVRGGTWVELSGAERELLEGLARDLVPAPTEPPAL